VKKRGKESQRVEQRARGYALKPFERCIKNNILKVQDGVEALKAIGSLGNLIPILWEESAEILKIATASGLTTRDSTYLWLSKKLEGKLITADEELRRRGEIITKTVLLGELGSFLKHS